MLETERAVIGCLVVDWAGLPGAAHRAGLVRIGLLPQGGAAGAGAGGGGDPARRGHPAARPEPGGTGGNPPLRRTDAPGVGLHPLRRAAAGGMAAAQPARGAPAHRRVGRERGRHDRRPAPGGGRAGGGGRRLAPGLHPVGGLCRPVYRPVQPGHAASVRLSRAGRPDGRAAARVGVRAGGPQRPRQNRLCPVPPAAVRGGGAAGALLLHGDGGRAADDPGGGPADRPAQRPHPGQTADR